VADGVDVAGPGLGPWPGVPVFGGAVGVVGGAPVAEVMAGVVGVGARVVDDFGAADVGELGPPVVGVFGATVEVERLGARVVGVGGTGGGVGAGLVVGVGPPVVGVGTLVVGGAGGTDVVDVVGAVVVEECGTVVEDCGTVVVELEGSVVLDAGGAVVGGVCGGTGAASEADAGGVPGAAAVAVLSTDGTADAPTTTVRVNEDVAPTSRGPGRPQVTVCPEAEQVQPGPVPER
jgi:hypothetical protein